MSVGPNTFTWRLTAAHFSKDWRYFITKPDWNPDAPISRSSFDLKPFCTNSNSRPGLSESHSCNVPQRSGYHLILAVWDVGDTSNSFYQVIDAEFSGNNPAPATTSTTTSTSTTPEQPITTERTNQGSVSTTTTTNRSGDNNNVNKGGTPASGLNVSGVADTYNAGSNLNINFNVSTSKAVKVRYFVRDKLTKARIATGKSRLSSGSHDMTATIKHAKPGKYKLVVIGKTAQGERFVERSHFKIVNGTTTKTPTPPRMPAKADNYDYSFPENIASYGAGTKVLQPKDGKVYKCRPFPFSGFCGQWSVSANQLEPGVGLYWQLAWKLTP